MSRLDSAFFRRFWLDREVPATVEGCDVEPEAALPANSRPAVSPLLQTTYEKTKPQVAADELVVSNRLADLVEQGMSPLEAAQRLFLDERNGS